MEKEIEEKNARYLLNLQTLGAVAKVLMTMDLKEMLEMQSKAEATGPILHPTMWLEKEKDFKLDCSLTDAALEFKNKLIKIYPLQVKA
jgi:hypothetical protein